MKQYFYLFNYPPEEYDLCALEFKYLFHEEYQQCFITNKDIDVNISVFMKGKIDIWAISSNFDDLKEEVKRDASQLQCHRVNEVCFVNLILPAFRTAVQTMTEVILRQLDCIAIQNKASLVDTVRIASDRSTKVARHIDIVSNAVKT